MRRLFKAFVILVAAGMLAFGMGGVALAAAIAHSGLLTVSVQERSADGTRLFIPVPAAFIELGVGALPLLVPEREMDRARRELAPYRQGLRSLAETFEEMPDVTLVHVESARETVKVTKRGRSLTVEVHAPDTDVRISVPAASLRRLVDALT